MAPGPRKLEAYGHGMVHGVVGRVIGRTEGMGWNGGARK